MRIDRRFWTAPTETYEQLRARMISETSEYLTECLRRPELAPRIPMIETGTGTFPPSMAKAFWDSVLFG